MCVCVRVVLGLGVSCWGGDEWCWRYDIVWMEYGFVLYDGKYILEDYGGEFGYSRFEMACGLSKYQDRLDVQT